MTRPFAREHERGAGVIGTSAGFLVFMLLMLMAVQVLFNLYANTIVTAAAHDAARSVASFSAGEEPCDRVPAANRELVDSLGDYADAAVISLAWVCDGGDVVVLSISALHPTVLPERMRGLLGLGSLEREITIRVEEFQQ